MDSYYPEENRWKKKYEVTIPILLLILVGVVLAWQMGWLAELGLFGRGPVDVIILGEDSGLEYRLDEVKAVPVNYDTIDLETMEGIRDPAYLDDFDIIIITEEIGEQPGELPGLFRNHVSLRLEDGANLILYGVAGSIDTGPEDVDGWVQHGMDRFVPVTCGRVRTCPQEKSNYSVHITDLKFEDMNHDIFEGLGVKTEFTGEGPIQYSEGVNPVSGAETIASIEVETEVGTTAETGIVERSYSGVKRGRAIYFGYHPSRTPLIFENTIEYLSR